MVNGVKARHDNRQIRALLTTLGVLVLFRVGSHVISPAVSPGRLQDGAQDIGGLLQLKGAQAFSLFGLGVVPYVSAALLLTLLGRSVPYLQRLRQEGPAGAARQKNLVRLVAVLLGALTSVTTASQGGGSAELLTGGVTGLALHVLFQAAGLLVLLALTEFITRHGVGNGVSIILVVSILSGVAPATTTVAGWPPAASLTFLGLSVISVVGIVLASRWTRTIDVYPIHPQSTGGRAGSVPFRTTSGGAGPMLFAGSLMVATSAMVRLLPLPEEIAGSLRTLFDMRSTTSLILLAVLTALLARLYANVAADPVETANNLTASGRFLFGTPPGLATARVLAVATNASGWLYAAVLLPVALWPAALQLVLGQPVPQTVSGSALVIPVLVVTEIVSGMTRRR
jgi:preprotein translocase subunit SecY